MPVVERFTRQRAQTCSFAGHACWRNCHLAWCSWATLQAGCPCGWLLLRWKKSHRSCGSKMKRTSSSCPSSPSSSSPSPSSSCLSSFPWSRRRPASHGLTAREVRRRNMVSAHRQPCWRSCQVGFTLPWLSSTTWPYWRFSWRNHEGYCHLRRCCCRCVPSGAINEC